MVLKMKVEDISIFKGQRPDGTNLSAEIFATTRGNFIELSVKRKKQSEQIAAMTFSLDVEKAMYLQSFLSSFINSNTSK